jgi:hypothetical protein
MNECSCQAFFLYRNLLATLLCHWLVGRSGRRGLRNDFRSLRRKGPFPGPNQGPPSNPSLHYISGAGPRSVQSSTYHRTLRSASVGGVVRGSKGPAALPALRTHEAQLRIRAPVRSVWWLPPLRWVLNPAGAGPSAAAARATTQRVTRVV